MTYRISIPGKGTYWANKPKGRKTWWKVSFPSSCGRYMYHQEHGGTVRDMKRDVLKEWPNATFKKM